MYIAEVIEVAVGLVFVYLSLSLTCSQIHEMIARWLDWRAKQLETALYGMIASPQTAPSFISRLQIAWLDAFNRLQNWWRNLRGQPIEMPPPGKLFIAELYTHALIRALIQPGNKAGPEFIPASTFASALLQTLMRAGTTRDALGQALAQARRQLLSAPGLSALERERLELRLRKEFDPLIRQIAAGGNVLLPTLLRQVEALAAAYPELKQTLELAKLRAGIEAQKGSLPTLYRALYTLISEAEVNLQRGETTLSAVRTQIESWFNSTMERTTIWYKLNVQKVIFVIALALALVVNIDSIAIVASLWREPTLRQAVNEQARLAAQAPAATSAITTTASITSTSPLSLTQVIRDLNSSLSELHLPVGWQIAALQAGQQCALIPLASQQVFCVPFSSPTLAFTNTPHDGFGWLIKLGGILLSALAAMQGAPFWFDILQKLVSVGESTRKQQAKEERAAPSG